MPSYLIKDIRRETGIEDKTALLVLRMTAQQQSVAKIEEISGLTKGQIQKIVEEEGNKVYIDDFKREYLAAVMEVGISNKRIRMDDLQYARDRLLAELTRLPVGEDMPGVCKIVRELVVVLDRAQNEIEYKPMQLDQLIAGYNALGRLTDEQLYERKEALVKMAARGMGQSIETTVALPGDSPTDKAFLEGEIVPSEGTNGS